MPKEFSNSYQTVKIKQKFSDNIKFDYENKNIFFGN